MKDVSFFKEKIESKLECAEEFSEMAVEIKPSNARVAKCLMDLADIELKSAEKLEYIMDELYGGVSADGYMPNDYNDSQHEILRRYSDAKTNVRNMKDMYSKRQGGMSARRYDGRNDRTGRYY